LIHTYIIVRCLADRTYIIVRCLVDTLLHT
jgi:hypothetical protein